jgi:hypothetical protein
MLPKLSNAGHPFVPSFDDGKAQMLACMEQSLKGVVSKKRNPPCPVGAWSDLGQVEDADMAAGEQGQPERMQGR